MKLLIDIDENTYRQAKEENDYEVIYNGYEIARAIINGIPVSNEVNCKKCDGYEAGYSAGLKDAERPQGEWKNDSDNLPICNKCGEIALQRIFVKMPHLIQDVRMVRSNYCPNCGADMRGGAE